MKGAAPEKQEVLGQWPGINTQFTYAGQRLGWAELWTNYVIYFSHVSGPSYSSRCWAKVNTVLAKHTPLLTSGYHLAMLQCYQVFSAQVKLAPNTQKTFGQN